LVSINEISNCQRRTGNLSSYQENVPTAITVVAITVAVASPSLSSNPDQVSGRGGWCIENHGRKGSIAMMPWQNVCLTP
jgi:hypothetical protein